MHFIWANRCTDHFTDFQEFFEKFQLTPRSWNSQTNLQHILKYISWTLNVNINLLGFKRTNIIQKCGHKNTYFLYYKFQNTLVKMLRKPHPFVTVNLVYYNKTFFVLFNANVTPYLIKANSQNHITHKNMTILPIHIMQILKQECITFPFNINIYTAYSYIRNYSYIKITSNLIGKYVYENSDKKILHIFITPNMEGHDITMCSLTDVKLSNDGNTLNSLANSHSPEGNPIFRKQKKTKDLLNQNYCVCDHPETQRIFLPTKFRNLGMTNIIYHLITKKLII